MDAKTLSNAGREHSYECADAPEAPCARKMAQESPEPLPKFHQNDPKMDPKIIEKRLPQTGPGLVFFETLLDPASGPKWPRMAQDASRNRSKTAKLAKKMNFANVPFVSVFAIVLERRLPGQPRNAPDRVRDATEKRIPFLTPF